MKTTLNCLLLTLLFGAGSALARDEQAAYPIDAVLQSAAAKERLDPTIRLFFGTQKHAAVGRDLGEWKTNKKTNGFNKSDDEACAWVFLSAVLELQERAAKQGGNAVVDIRSNYKNVERSSETEYTCGSGALMSGVALKGRVVTLGN